jgi:hypothetical protein
MKRYETTRVYFVFEILQKTNGNYGNTKKCVVIFPYCFVVKATLSCSKPEGLEVFFRSMPLNETIVISFKEHITPKKYLDGVDDEHILKYEIYVFDQIGFEKTQLTKTKYTRVVSQILLTKI